MPAIACPAGCGHNTADVDAAVAAVLLQYHITTKHGPAPAAPAAGPDRQKAPKLDPPKVKGDRWYLRGQLGDIHQGMGDIQSRHHHSRGGCASVPPQLL